MSKKEKEIKEEQEIKAEEQTTETATNEANANEAAETEEPAEESLEEQNKKLVEQLEKEKKEYLFLMAEFDNFRKRTIREKADILRNGGEKAFGDLLPVIDDFERAIKANENNDDVEALKEGVNLIYNKFMKYLEQNQVKPIESTGKEFDTELHEAVTAFPTDDEAMKGKVIDTVQTGYTINDKVLRHAKVVVGQ